jgi:hypothetical protein
LPTFISLLRTLVSLLRVPATLRTVVTLLRVPVVLRTLATLPPVPVTLRTLATPPRLSVTLRTLVTALAAGVICTAAAAAAENPAHIDLAHSAQLTVDAQETPDAVTLWVRHATDKKLVDTKDVTVSIEGKNQVVTRRSDGSFSFPSDDLRGKEAKPVQLVVGHDGIRELLDGQLPPPPEGIATGLLGSHNQLWWWVINIGVLFIGVLALSRRKSY